MSTQRSAKSKGTLSSKELQSLRAQVVKLQETNAILELRNQKAVGAEEKIEMVLKQNNQLTAQNYKLSRMVQGQKVESQALKEKCQKIDQLQQRWEEERQQLEDEVDDLKTHLSEAQKYKASQASEQKNQSKLEIEVYRQKFTTNQESYSRQMRRLRDQLRQTEEELEQSQKRLNKVTTQWQCDMIRWKEEKEKLKNALTYAETDRNKEVQSLRSRLENNYNQEIEVLKRMHVTNMEQQQMQAARLRERVTELQAENHVLKSKNTKMRTEYEDTIAVFRRDIENYQGRLADAEVFRQQELSDMKAQLTSYYHEKIEQLKAQHELSETKMLEEASRIEKYLRAKIGDAEDEIISKGETKKQLQEEIYALKAQKGELEFKYKEREDTSRQEKEETAETIADKNRQISYLEGLIQQQKRFNQQEANELSELIRDLKSKLDQQTAKAKAKEEELCQKIVEVQKDLAQVQDDKDETLKDFAKQIFELKNELEGKSSHLDNQTESFAEHNKSMRKEVQRLRETLGKKDEEIKTMIERLHESVERETRLENEIEDIRNKALGRQEGNASNFKQLQARLESTYQLSLQALEQQHSKTIKDQESRYNQLKIQLKQKDEELMNLLQRYQRLVEEFQRLTKQEANKKNLTLKFAGSNAGLLASKNIFDVYLKKKVLDECGSVLREKLTLT